MRIISNERELRQSTRYGAFTNILHRIAPLFYASGLSPRDFLQSRIGEEDIPETEENTLMLEFAAYLRQNCQ